MKTIIRFILYLFTLYFEAKNVILRQGRTHSVYHVRRRNRHSDNPVAHLRAAARLVLQR